jgi:hypothetical protein
MDSLGRYCALSEDWRRLHVEDLQHLCCSPDILGMNSIGESCGANGRDGVCIQGFGGKTLRKESILMT